jgi:ABC-type transport system involved in multi-copper enzyme maturation permease subunit
MTPKQQIVKNPLLSAFVVAGVHAAVSYLVNALAAAIYASNPNALVLVWPILQIPGVAIVSGLYFLLGQDAFSALGSDGIVAITYVFSFVVVFGVSYVMINWMKGRK